MIEVAALFFLIGLILGVMTGFILGAHKGYQAGKEQHQSFLEGCEHCRDFHQ